MIYPFQYIEGSLLIPLFLSRRLSSFPNLDNYLGLYYPITLQLPLLLQQQYNHANIVTTYHLNPTMTPIIKTRPQNIVILMKLHHLLLPLVFYGIYHIIRITIHQHHFNMYHFVIFSNRSPCQNSSYSPIITLTLQFSTTSNYC